MIREAYRGNMSLPVSVLARERGEIVRKSRYNRVYLRLPKDKVSDCKETILYADQIHEMRTSHAQ